MIPLELLKNYQGRAIATCIYGNGGLEKTLAVRTLPAPILHLDFEGGSGCLGPWTRYYREWDAPKWRVYTQEEREHLFNLVSEEKRRRALIKPLPLIDIISYKTMTASEDGKQSPAWNHLTALVAAIPKEYNSLAIDPLVEFSQASQTQSKVKSGYDAMVPMHVKLWGGAQEYAAMLLRRMRELRDQGLFIYMTSSEFVDKDYGTDPRESGQKEEPYAVKGTLNVPGQLVNKVNHMLDLQFHVRQMTGNPSWVTQEEPARSGSFNWEAKDRTGRIADKYLYPNMRTVIKAIYGEEDYNAIYAERSKT